MTSCAYYGVGDQRYGSIVLPPGKKLQYSLCWRLGRAGLEGYGEQALLLPRGFESRAVKPVESRYTY